MPVSKEQQQEFPGGSISERSVAADPQPCFE